MLENIIKVCKDCNKEFIFTTKEQMFYTEKQYDEPLRCKECRKTLREKIKNKIGAIIPCHRCGKEAKVPFVPVNGKPVYCSNCLVSVRKFGKT